MRNRYKRIGRIAAICLLAICVGGGQLAGGAFGAEPERAGVNTDKQACKAGDMIKVTVRMENAVELYGYQAKIRFDADQFSYVKNSVKDAKKNEFGEPFDEIDRYQILNIGATKQENAAGSNGSFDLFSFELKALKSGVSEIALDSFFTVSSEQKKEGEKSVIAVSKGVMITVADNTGGDSGGNTGGDTGGNTGGSTGSGRGTSGIAVEETAIQDNQTPLAGAVFADIQNHWAKEFIEYLAGKGLINGIGNNLFGPDLNITREAFVQILAGMAGIDKAAYQSQVFTDVPKDRWSSPAIAWAAEKKIVNGTGEGMFSPTAFITREQIATMLLNYAKATGYALPQTVAPTEFADQESISAYAKEAVSALQQAGIVNGKATGENVIFDPKGNATRAEAAKMLTTYLRGHSPDVTQ